MGEQVDTILIGIVGTKGQGKDSLADAIISRADLRGKTSKKVALADPIKAAMSSALFQDPSIFHDQTKKEQPIPGFDVTPRVLMQKFGTDFMQNLMGSDVWLKVFESRLLSWKQTNQVPDITIVTDIRFAHELNWISGMGAHIIFIRRDWEHVEQSALDRFLGRDVHISEKGLYHMYDPHEDYWVENIFSMDHLYKTADSILSELLGEVINDDY